MKILKDLLHPDSLRHWEWVQKLRVKRPDAICQCILCKSVPLIEAALTHTAAPEPEWEYRARSDYGRVIASGSEEEIEVAIAASHYSPSLLIERRRKAGTWEPVGGDDE